MIGARQGKIRMIGARMGRGRTMGSVVRGRKVVIARADRTETVECRNRFSLLEESESGRGDCGEG